MKTLISIVLTLCIVNSLFSQEEGPEFCDCYDIIVSDEGIPILFNISEKIRQGAPYEIVTPCRPLIAPCDGTCEWRIIPGEPINPGICLGSNSGESAFWEKYNKEQKMHMDNRKASITKKNKYTSRNEVSFVGEDESILKVE